jgi:hypothetical protein
MRRFVLTAAATLAVASTSFAITAGTKDTTNIHANVGVLVARAVGGGGFLCSGTLIHPRVVLTAGHCTQGFQDAIDDGVVSGIDQVSVNFLPTNVPFPNTPGNLAVDRMITHPKFRFRSQMSSEQTDIGLVFLKEPVRGITPAVLPRAGLLDDMKKRRLLRPGSTFRLAGYGTHLDPIAPPTPTLDFPFQRRYVDAEYKQVIKRHINFKQNIHSGPGGACFGDSGGPAFIDHPRTGEPVLVGVTSWGDQKCIGTGFYSRTDLPDVLRWINANLPNRP